MAALLELWLPILLSAVGVFLVSSVLHMLVPWHCGDVDKMAGEDAVLDAIERLRQPVGRPEPRLR